MLSFVDMALDHKDADDDVLLSALADAIGVYYNATGDVECFSPAAGANNASSVDGDNWNWQVGVNSKNDARPLRPPSWLAKPKPPWSRELV